MSPGRRRRLTRGVVTAMGSRRYAGWLAERNEPVTAMISLETLSYFSDRPGSQKYPPPFGLFFGNRGDFIAIVGLLGARTLVHDVVASFRRSTSVQSIGGVAPEAIQGIGWSDHQPFAARGIPSVMITDTAVFRYPYYHTTEDTPDKLDYAKLARVTFGIERVVRDLIVRKH